MALRLWWFWVYNNFEVKVLKSRGQVLFKNRIFIHLKINLFSLSSTFHWVMVILVIYHIFVVLSIFSFLFYSNHCLINLERQKKNLTKCWRLDISEIFEKYHCFTLPNEAAFWKIIGLGNIEEKKKIMKGLAKLVYLFWLSV